MQMKKQFSFTSLLESVRLNLLTTAVYLPHHIIIELPKGRLRVSGTINGSPFSLAIQYRRDGSRYFTVGSALRKAANIDAGDTVHVSFKVLNLNVVELPDALEVVVHQDNEVKKIGRTFSKPAKETLSDYVSAIKNMDVRMKRSIEKVQRSKIGALQPQPNKKNKNK